MVKMYYKKQNCMVHVYDVFKEKHTMAIIYSPHVGGAQGGCGWMTVRAKDLIPEEYFDGKNGFESKSFKNRIKERLTLVNPIWRASDGTDFEDIKEAIAYEKTLYEKEVIENEELL